MTVAEIIGNIFLPLSLAIIMLGMGMTLVMGDFTRILKYPKAILLGLINQLIFLPIIGFGLAILFNLNPIMAVGLMILATCPGGPTSNLITHVCKGNIALSVTLTAFSSVISIFTIPFILSYALDYFGGTTNVLITLPVGETMLQIMGITVIPICLGMLLRRSKPTFAKRMEKPIRIASTVLFLIVFMAIVVANYAVIGRGLKEVGFVTLLLNVCTMALGYLTARLFKLEFKNAISITVESGIQNGTLALVIATAILNNVEMGISIASYAIWMFVTGGILMLFLSKRPEVITKKSP